MEYTSIFFGLFVLWVLQSIFTFFQLKYFWGYIKTLKKNGEKVFIGRAGSFLKLYILITRNDQGELIRIEELSGLSVFARFKSLPDITSQDIYGEQCPTYISQKQWKALKNASNSII